METSYKSQYLKHRHKSVNGNSDPIGYNAWMAIPKSSAKNDGDDEVCQ